MAYDSSLESVLSQVREKISRHRSSGVNEQNTKATLIDPVLQALGWDLGDFEEVHREYKSQRADNPVDYALLVLGHPLLFLEAKPLGGDLNDRRWANQIMGYAAVAGVEWVALTNGDEYRIYNAHAPVPVDEKIFRSVRISDGKPETANTLELLSKAQLPQKQIDALWQAHFIDSQIKTVMENLLSPEPAPALINLVRRQLPNFSPSDIRAGLHRLQVRVETSPRFEPPTKPSRNIMPPSPESPELSDKAHTVSIIHLIEAGLIRPPVTISKRYKGRLLEAQIGLDGKIHFNGKVFDSLSHAGGTARLSVLGPGRKPPATNGWDFWQIKTDDGRFHAIDVLRQRYRTDYHSAS